MLGKYSKSTTENLKRLTACASDYGYIIGSQNSRFPAFGEHIKGEMGGVWIHPIKLLDGYWLEIGGDILTADSYTIHPYYNEFAYNFNNDLHITRFDFMPDEYKGAVVKYRFGNKGLSALNMECNFIMRTDLSHVWFGDHLGIENGQDFAEIDNKRNTFVVKDEKNNWFCCISSSEVCNLRSLADTPAPDGNTGLGLTLSMQFKVEIQPNQVREISFFISGSYLSKEECISHNNEIKNRHDELFLNKEKRYSVVLNKSKVTTDNPEFDDMLAWIKFNTTWHIQKVDGFGRGLVGGIPEYVWWFGCDSAYALQGALALGDVEIAKDTAILLRDFSARHNGNGRIVHEITTQGGVSNPGNVQETALYITMVYKIFQWSGDLEFLKEVYEYCKKGIEWLLSLTDEQNLCPIGYGIMEIEGLDIKMIDVAAYTCEALFDMHELSAVMGQQSNDYLEKATILKDFINNVCFDQNEQLYCDGLATPQKLLSRFDKLVQRAKEHSKVCGEYLKFLDEQEKKLSALPEKEIPFLLAKNWIIFTPMESGISDYDKGIAALEGSFNSDYFCKYGVYLSSLMKDHVMTISTGVRAVAEARYGRVNESYELLKCIQRTFGMYLPGSITEMSPDYGCFAQAWTAYSVLVPVVNYFFGIKSDAIKKTISIKPNVPSEFHSFKIENVCVGDTTISVDIKKTSETLDVEIYVSCTKWNVNFITPDDYECQDTKILSIPNGNTHITLKSKGNVHTRDNFNWR